MLLIKKLIVTGIFALGMIGFSSQAYASCGKITIAEMDWASAEMFAHIDKVVLENAYGCEVELVPGATMPTCLLYTSPSPRDLSTSRMPSSA